MIQDKRIVYYKRKVKEIKKENKNILAENELLNKKIEKLEKEIESIKSNSAYLEENLGKIRKEYKDGLENIRGIRGKYNKLLISMKEDKLKYRDEINQLISNLKNN